MRDMNKTWMIIAAVALALIGFWLFQDILGSLLGGLVGMEAVRQKKRASKVKAQEADKRQDYHTEKSATHAYEAVDSQQEAHDVAEQKDDPVKERPGFVKKVFRSK